MGDILTTQPSLKVIMIYLFIYKAYHRHGRGVLIRKKNSFLHQRSIFSAIIKEIRKYSYMPLIKPNWTRFNQLFMWTDYIEFMNRFDIFKHVLYKAFLAFFKLMHWILCGFFLSKETNFVHLQMYLSVIYTNWVHQGTWLCHGPFICLVSSFYSCK